MNYQKPVPEMYASENFVAVNDFLTFRHKIRKSFKLHRVDNSYIQRDILFYYRINRGYNLGLYSDFTIIIIIIIIIIIFIERLIHTDTYRKTKIFTYLMKSEPMI